TAPFDDALAGSEMARGCQVVTLEIEKASLQALEAVAHYAPMRPGPHVLAVVQDRARQKAWLKQRRFPIGDYREAKDDAELAAAVRALGGTVFAKATHGGYGGKGQVVLRDPFEAA